MLGHQTLLELCTFTPITVRQAILCYICIWSHGSLQVHFLVGGLASKRTGLSGRPMLFFRWGCNQPMLLQFFLQSPPTRFLEVNLVVASKYPHLYWSVAGQTSSTPGPLIKCLLTMATVLGLVSADMMDLQMEQSPVGPSFSLCSIFYFGQEHF